MIEDGDSPDHHRYQSLKQAIEGIGLLRRGSVVRRFMPCGKPGCCCQADVPILHGPYFQWTRKVRGKTVTVRLTEEEAKTMTDWISNGRQLDKIVASMEAVSFRITERLLKQLRRKARRQG